MNPLPSLEMYKIIKKKINHYFSNHCPSHQNKNTEYFYHNFQKQVAQKKYFASPDLKQKYL